MRRVTLITVVASVVLVSRNAAAQAGQHELLGARIEVESQVGLKGKRTKSKGEVIEITSESVTIRTDQGLETILLATIVGLKERRPTRQTWRGFLLGDVIATASLGDRTDSDAILIGLAAAGAGAVLGSRITLQEFQRTRVAGLRGEPTAGTIVKISAQSGGRFEGLLLSTTGDSLVIEEETGEVIRFARREVSEIQWPSGRKPPSPFPPLILGLAGGAIGYAATTRDCRGEFICFTGLGAIPGYLIGTGIGYAISLSNRTWRWEGPEQAAPVRIGLLTGPVGTGVGVRLEF